MSFTLVSQPAKFAPAYKPVLWSFSSSFAPVNTNAGESNIPVLEIRIATQADVDAYGVNITDVLMFFATTPDVLYQYQQFSVQGTDDALYSGTYRVRRVVSDSLVVIDAEYAGDDTGGTWTKVYERYTLIAEVTFSGLRDPVRYELKAAPDETFTMDIQDAAQRGFQDILSHVDCRPGTDYTTMAEGENYITQTYTVRIFHGYVYTDSDGAFQFVEVTKGISTVYPKQVVVNAVQPDNHVDIDGTVELSWQTNLVPYLMDPALVGGSGRKWLTYGPMEGQIAGVDDDLFLAFLFIQRNGWPLTLQVTQYGSDGIQIQSDDFPFLSPLNSGVLAVGPRNLGSLLSVNAASVSIRIIDEDLEYVSRLFTYNVDRKCGEAYVRPQALNPLGGIDSIGLNVRQRDGVSVERFTMSKPNMEVNASTDWTGDFNRRTWAIEMERTYGVSSKPMTADLRKHFGENIFTSPDVRIPINDTRWTPIIITTKELAMYTSEKKPAPIRFEFVLGVDNFRQRR